MEKPRRFKFNIREFAGSLGDFGTLIPFTVGYIVICGFNPTGLLLGIGLTNIVLALVYGLPLPVQPKKVVGTVAISQRWSPSMVIGTGFSLGVLWLALAAGRVGRVIRKTPKCVIRGIQLGLSLTLGFTALNLMADDILLGVVLLALGLFLLGKRVLPASIVLVFIGFVLALLTGNLRMADLRIGFVPPQLHLFLIDEMIYGLLYAGIAQVFLTLTNAVMATVTLVHDLFPDRTDLTPQNLITNMGAMNVITPLFGGMPLCHGAGGLAAQYLFGARTGGALLIEGSIEIILALFLSQSILEIFTAFPNTVIGVMLLLAALELGRISLRIEKRENTIVVVFIALLSVAFNIAVGFIGGLLLYIAMDKGLIKLKTIRGENDVSSEVEG